MHIGLSSVSSDVHGFDNIVGIVHDNAVTMAFYMASIAPCHRLAVLQDESQPTEVQDLS